MAGKPVISFYKSSCQNGFKQSYPMFPEPTIKNAPLNHA